MFYYLYRLENRVKEFLKDPGPNWKKLIEGLDRRLGWYRQRMENQGIDERDTWDLCSGITDFVLPRLVAFRKWSPVTPVGFTPEEWREVLDKMIWSFQCHRDLQSGDKSVASKKEQRQMEQGFRLFTKYIHLLWW